MEQFAHPQAQEDLPFFLFLMELAIIAINAAAMTAAIMIVGKFIMKPPYFLAETALTESVFSLYLFLRNNR